MSETLVVVGSQWGDEGKGKITDYFATRADMVVRYQGGNNAAKRNGAPENWGLNFDTENLMFGFSYSF